MAKTSRRRTVKTAAAARRTSRKAVRRPPARKTSGRTTAGRPKPRRTAKTKRPATSRPALFAPVKGAQRLNRGRVEADVGRAGDARVKRLIYPAGFHWAADMQPEIGTDLCMHAHVGFLAHGEIHIEYADGCIVEYKAPQIVAIEPGHDGWVVGSEPVVLIEFDFERDTVERLGMPPEHRHE